MRQVLTAVYPGRTVGIDDYLYLGVAMSTEPETGSARGEGAGGGGWAPDACTLPTSERPLRAADFDAVFAATVRDLERVGPTRLRLDLEPSPQAAARMAELAAAETGCCSFFSFALTATGGALTLDITVPQQYAPVLAALADRAGAAAGLAS
jgi:hypothetical protein